MEMEKWKHGDKDMETWKHGELETWRHGDLVTWSHGDMKTWRHGDLKRKTEAQAIFLNPFPACSLCKLKFAIGPFADEETNGSYQGVCKLTNGTNGLTDLPIYGRVEIKIELSNFGAQLILRGFVIM
jgi:hypothetical protein